MSPDAPRPSPEDIDAQPGDLILVQSPGRFFAACRRAVGSPYDHVAVVVSDGRTLNIDKPSSRYLSAARLLREELKPLVLRPRWQSRASQAAFVEWIEGLEGYRYDTPRTLRLIGSLAVERLLGVAWPLPPAAREQTAWICTDAVWLGLLACEPTFRELPTASFAFHTLGAGTTNDFLRLAREHPHVMEQVSP